MKKLLSVFVVISLLAAMFVPFNAYAAEDMTALFKNQGYSRKEIIEKYNSMKPIVNGDSGYKTVPSFAAPYFQGELTDTAIDNGLKTINFARYLAGLNDNVTVTADNNMKAQCGAYLNAYNKQMSHYPEKPAELPAQILEDGDWGCAHGNLFSSGTSWKTSVSDNTFVDAALSWLEDSDDYNIDRVGHRRWVLDPGMTTTGFGGANREEIVNGYYRSYAAMISFNDDRSNAKKDTVLWPSAGYFPIEFFEKGYYGEQAWSISLNSSKYSKKDIANLQVEFSDKQGNVQTLNSGSGEFYVDTQGFGMDYCIIFRPSAGILNGGEYHVKVTGLVPVSGSGVSDTLEYDVCFFSLDQTETPVNIKFTEPTAPVKIDGTAIVKVYVADKNANAPLSGIKVTLSNGQSAVSDADGFAVFTVNNAGSLKTLSATSEGGYIGGSLYSGGKTAYDCILKQLNSVKIPFSADGKLTAGIGRADSEYYAFDGIGGAEINISLSSKDFDSSLKLCDSTMKPIMTNDDMAPGYMDSLITFKLPKDGKYYIQATHRLPVSGAFTISAYYTVEDMAVSPASATLNAGQTKQLSVQYTPNFPFATVWTSSNKNVATVDENGKVTAVGAGTATITAAHGARSEISKITVVVPSNSITLDKTSVTLNIDESATLKATVLPADATNKTVTWKSSDTAVVKVSGGKLTPVAAGTATVTASNGSLTAECKVTVTSNVKSITINKTSASMVEGDSVQLTATVVPSQLQSSVTWKSSDASVAAVDKNGKVTAVKAGTATITAAAGSKSVTCKITVTAKPKIPSIVRLGGASRNLTAIAISNEGWTSSNTVVLANSMNYADALCGVSLASYIDAPILLSAGKGAALEPEVLAQIEKLGAKKVIILGGYGAISTEIENALKKSYDVMRLRGASRYETSIAVAEYLDSLKGAKSTSFIAVTGTGYADALSISPYAGMTGTPVIYVNSALGLQDVTVNYIKGMKNAYAIGGPGAVSEDILAGFGKLGITAERIRGADRFETSAKVAEKYSDMFQNDVMIATGMNFPDALAGGVLAAKRRVPLLLTNNSVIPECIASYIRTSGADKVYIAGGKTLIPDSSVINLF